MKILGLSGSPREDGNTVILLKEVFKGAEEEGAETELYSVAGKNLQPCRGCMTCQETGKCTINDDVSKLFEKMLKADGIVFGVPVYFYNMTSQLKIIMDRSFSLNTPERSLANKVGGAVSAAGSFGMGNALKDIYFYMVTRQIIPANYVAAYGGPKGAVKEMEKCMQAADMLGRQMARIIKQGFKYPADIPRSSFAYGTHTL
ncbi:MAG: flavodoxin family protein [Spirochaetes bacterium]|nr:flavodoxin family protein [Spirochaetota bacterium]